MLKPIEGIYESFYQEFGCLKDKFSIILLSMTEARESQDSKVAMPGVYIIWKENKIIKVGRHLDNSRKRALEHIRVNTKNEIIEMATLENCREDCGIVLINCQDRIDYHWVAAIEIYMENILDPIIRSKRAG